MPAVTSVTANVTATGIYTIMQQGETVGLDVANVGTVTGTLYRDSSDPTDKTASVTFDLTSLNLQPDIIYSMTYNMFNLVVFPATTGLADFIFDDDPSTSVLNVVLRAPALGNISGNFQVSF